uniref:monoamine oxidase n=1 Tax=Lotharella globosa TaxID=91324 RepID=A0A7S4DP29_9EUKA
MLHRRICILSEEDRKAKQAAMVHMSQGKLPIAVIGAGVSGLYTALLLQRTGLPVVVFEARNRIGGRVKSVTLGKDASKEKLERYDLGPSWFWPSSHRRMSGVVREFGLKAFPQPDSGAYTYDQGEGKEAMHFRGGGGMHGSYRVGGGMLSIVEAISSKLAENSVKLDSQVKSIKLVPVEGTQPEHVLLTISPKEGKQREFRASHVILALPPRLIAEGQPACSPALPSKVTKVLGSFPTWMAPHAKFVAVYPKAPWTEKGLSGNGAGQILGEVHEASPVEGRPAVFGFVGPDRGTRAKLGREKLISLARAQLTRMFGDTYEPEVLLTDWATEPLTASKADVLHPPRGHPEYSGLPSYATGLWGGRLDFAGSETADVHGGFLEGALASAEAAAERVLLSAKNSDGTDTCANGS